MENESSESGEKNEISKKIAKAHLSDALERLKKQGAIIDAKIQSAEARLKTSHRKQDTRRKILIGSYYLDKAVKENTYENLKLMMCGYLTRESDRRLFGFSPTDTTNDKNDKRDKTDKNNKTQKNEKTDNSEYPQRPKIPRL